MSKYCDEPAIYIPETGCSDCSAFEDRLDDMQDTIDDLIVGKQDKLTAGDNITIENDVISATDTTYEDATSSEAGLMSASDKSKLDGIASGAEVNVQADWDVSDPTSDAYIKNKPSIPGGLEHIFDGIADGSVRTSESAAEAGSYSLGDNAFSEGYYTKASGESAHAEGSETVASGAHSHAQNAHTVAGSDEQTAIGKWNDNNSDNAFEVGNGTGENDRSNAMAVTWDGDVIEGRRGDVLTANGILDGNLSSASEGYINLQGDRLDPELPIFNLSIKDYEFAFNKKAVGGSWSNLATFPYNFGALISGTNYSKSAQTGAKAYKVAELPIPSQGTYLIIAAGIFSNTGATGYRRIYVTDANFTDGTTTLPSVKAAMLDNPKAPANGVNDVVTALGFVGFGSATTIYAVAVQTSGSTITVAGRLYAIRVR